MFPSRSLRVFPDRFWEMPWWWKSQSNALCAGRHTCFCVRC